MSNQERVDQAKQAEAGQLELPLRMLPVYVVDSNASANILTFPAKAKNPASKSSDALSRILAYAETLAP